MGRRSDYPGVESHRGTLRVSFQVAKERCRESLNLPDTPGNRAKAAALRREIERRLNLGTFEYAEFFPNSKRVSRHDHTFAAVAQEWLELQAELATSTIEGYEQILNTHWIPKIGASAISAVTPGIFKRTLIDAKFKSDKTRNNCLSVGRMVFAYAIGERYIRDDPSKGLEFSTAEPEEPDPFTYDEMRAILKWMSERAHDQVHNYFWFAFFSGMRTSELIQLQWAKVDLHSGLVRVDEAWVRGEVKSTKTNKRRDVELNSESRAALVAQKAHTYLAGKHVFLNPNTGSPYYNQQSVWRVMRAALKALGIRHRPAYNTRHSFATLNLMAGANPYWVSKQLGHASLEMTLKAYAKWISGGDQGRERGRLEQFLKDQAGSDSPRLGPAAAKTLK